MTKIISFFKKFWILILVILAAILYLLNIIIKGNAPTTPQTPPSATVTPFKSLIPGVSTEDQVATALGRPVSSKTIDNQKISDYRSTNQYRFHEVVFTNGKAILIKEIVNSTDNKEADSIKTILGEPDYTLYSKLENDPFNLYVYPEKGLAYIGHPDGTLLEIWYFESTTIENFIADWGQDYSATKIENNNIQ